MKRDSVVAEVPFNLETAVVRVGAGRGFVIDSTTRGRFVVTAAHCLPHLPPACAASYIEERTYENLLGKLGSDTIVWAECLFVDPVADIAVLGCPDNQELFKQATDYQDLIDAAAALSVHRPGNCSGWVMSLGGQWVQTTIRREGGTGTTLEINATIGGQSGSPILNRQFAAIGVVVNGCEIGSVNGRVNCRAGLQPTLVNAIPRPFLDPRRLK